jgi:hypothetical protein
MAAKKTAKKVGGWKNRIVGYYEMPANQFLPHEDNARRHPAKQRESLRGSLDELGWVAPVIVSSRSGKILDGHARVEEALSKDEATPVPFVEVDVSEAEERLVLATYDPSTGLASYDREALDSLLKEVQTGSEALQELMGDLARGNQLYATGGNDIGEHWRGMPEFEQDDKTALQSIHVHFKTKRDVEDFARLINQTITEKTRSLWYPFIEIETYADKSYSDES